MFHVKPHSRYIIHCMNTSIKAFSIEELSSLLGEAHLPSYRTGQILSWLYQKGVSSYDEMTNIPKSVRAQLSDSHPLDPPHLIEQLDSHDGSRKYLIELSDGSLVETVGLPSDDGRLTVCISSQSGCAMGCIFCATGKAGLRRSLLPGEIVDQVLLVQNNYNQRVTNVVVMGQGEPFANFDNVIAALRILNLPKLLAIGARHITVSTCGVLKGIDNFSRIPEQFTLAVSLHAARQAVRDEIMPAMKSQPLDKLRSKLESYSNVTGRRYSFEYALMKGLNDSEADLSALVEYCKGLLCHVNLIPLNEIEDSPIHPVSMKTMSHWQHVLESSGIACSIRRSRGGDIAAACGQLASKHGTRKS